MKIKIPNYEDKGVYYLESYKIVGPNQFRVSLSIHSEDAGEFDEDDYIKELCKYWFGEINEFR